MNWGLDLDGVVWLADHAIPGAAEAIGRLRDAGEYVMFVTNNSGPTVGEVEAKLAKFGVEADGAVVTSSMAAASLVQPGELVLVAGGDGLREAVSSRGAEVMDGDDESRTPDA